MVMEAKPSPLVVGREFVRQYYTLLHNSPDHLHRFYNQHSSFTHGGLDPEAKDDLLIVGQKNIHDKIQQLNFRDCHAKISYVDAQATLGDGVVVQVSGELSNDGHPMRRFTQTFVLACQSPKKYYVHNDIFRYQDVLNEDDESTDNGLETSSDAVNSSDGSTILTNPNQNVYYPSANVVVNNPPGIVNTYVAQPMSVPAVPQQVNGVMHEDMLKSISTQTTQAVAPIIPTAQAPVIQQVAQSIPISPAPAALPLPVEPVAIPSPEIVQMASVPINDVKDSYDAEVSTGEETESLDNSKESEQNLEENVSVQPLPAQSVPAPKNWANLVRGDPGGYTPTPPPANSSNSEPTSFIAITQQQQQQAQQQQKMQAETVYGNGERQARPVRNERDHRERRTSGSNFNNNGGETSNQLFLGNLPQRATEEELKALFSVFGKVAELRIHTKPQQNNSKGRPVPNYGFITFEDPSCAQKLQNAQPIYYPTLGDPNGQKLNVESKIRKDNGGGNRSGTNGQSNDRGRNNAPGNGMNRNGSGGRTEGPRRDDGQRPRYNRSDRGSLGPRPTNGNGTQGTYNNNNNNNNNTRR